MGEYFGGSVLGLDITGDGVDELIVGSPLSHITGFKLSPGDQGKVYIYINDGQVSYHLYFTNSFAIFFTFKKHIMLIGANENDYSAQDEMPFLVIIVGY